MIRQLYYKARRLWWKAFGCPIGPVTSKEVGLQVVGTGKLLSSRVVKETGRIMGKGVAGHPPDECKKRGCKI